MLRLPALHLAASLLLVSSTAFATVRPHHRTSAHALVRHSTATHGRHAVEHAAVEHSYGSGITSERATEIQSALIKQGYLSGEPTGSWDSASASAMQKLQSDNGWQTKLVPDSRALIKLGLGPNSNPEPSSSTTVGTAVADTATATAKMN